MSGYGPTRIHTLFFTARLIILTRPGFGHSSCSLRSREAVCIAATVVSLKGLGPRPWLYGCTPRNGSQALRR